MERARLLPISRLVSYNPPMLSNTAKMVLTVIINNMINKLVEYINKKGEIINARPMKKHSATRQIWLYRKDEELFSKDHEIWSHEFGNTVTKIINDKAAKKEIINVKVTFNKYKEHLNIDSFEIEYL